MSEVLQNLHKKDSLKVLLEVFEGSLHQADHINDNPDANSEDAQDLLKKEDCE